MRRGGHAMGERAAELVESCVSRVGRTGLAQQSRIACRGDGGLARERGEAATDYSPGFPRSQNCLTPINAHIYFGAHCRVAFSSNTASFRYAIWCSDSLGCAASFDHSAQRFARKTTISCVSSSTQTRYQRTITDNAPDQILESNESHSESITSPR